jgi:threonine dehydratase
MQMTPTIPTQVLRELERLSAPSHSSLRELAPYLLQAEQRIRQFIPRSPLRKSEWLSELTGAEVWLKLEGLNPTGSFKVRGAINALAMRLERQRAAGMLSTGDTGAVSMPVVAASAGNHAQGVAYAAREMGCPAHIFLPLGTPLIKQIQTRRLGAQIEVGGDTLDEAFARALKFVADHPGAVFLHAFNDFDVICGQATCLLECFEQYEAATAKPAASVDAFVCAVGGGGLAAGSGLAMTLMGAGRVVGVEQESFDSARVSLQSGRWLPVSQAGETTVADGIRVRLIGQQAFELMRQTMNEVALVSDDAIVGAITGLCENENVIAEGAGAASVAWLLHNPSAFKGQTVVACVCGGNIDNQLLTRVISRGLGVTGRMMRVVLNLGDRPGQLARALSLLAGTDANLLEVHHDRTYSKAHVGTVEVELSLETKDASHQESLLAILGEAGFAPRRL